MFKSDEIILPAENIWTLENYRHPYFGVKYNIKYNKFRGKIILSAQNNKLVIVDELPVSLYLRGLAEETKTEPLEKKKAIYCVRNLFNTYFKYSLQFEGMAEYILEQTCKCCWFEANSVYMVK